MNTIISLDLVFNAVVVLLMLSLVILLVETINNYKKKQKMYGIDSVYMNSKDFIRNNKFFKKYYKLINTVFNNK